MTVNRRRAFAAFALAAFGGAGWCFAQGRRPGQGVVTGNRLAAFAPEIMDNPEDLLLKDLARLSSRVYSEEGIPMILACENLVRAQQPSPGSTDLNHNLAAAFQRDADIWGRLHPDAAANDVAKILELLADRDFNAGGKETAL